MAIPLSRGNPAITELPELIDQLEVSTAQLGPFHPETVGLVSRLAVAVWKAGDAGQAIRLLNQALDGLASAHPPDDTVRSYLLQTLGEITVERGSWGQAESIYREILDCCIRRSGSDHATSLAAAGDLAVVLFESGKTSEAGTLEQDASDRARTHLGKTHPVTCVLAWNRAQRLEDTGDSDSARAIVGNDLLWLLSEDENRLEADQKALRGMLVQRWGWDAAHLC